MIDPSKLKIINSDLVEYKDASYTYYNIYFTMQIQKNTDEVIIFSQDKILQTLLIKGLSAIKSNKSYSEIFSILKELHYFYKNDYVQIKSAF